MKNNNIDILTEFGERISYFRKQAGYSQEKLAELASVHRTYIGMIERGEKNITLKNIVKIAKALNVDISELLRGING